MLTIHFGVREDEVPGFMVLFKRLADEINFMNLDTLSCNHDDWDKWKHHTLDVPRHVTLETREPMKTLNFLSVNFEPYLVHSNNTEMINARLVLTDSYDYTVEYEEFRW